VVVKRTDKWPIPVITPLVKAFTGLHVGFPKLHIGTIRHGFDRDSLVVDRKYYKGAPLYDCYDTQQIFLDRDHPQSVGVHTVLSPWHTTGRYLEPPLTTWEKVFPILMFPVAAIAWAICRLSPEAADVYRQQSMEPLRF
jgi:hypothetical protein